MISDDANKIGIINKYLVFIVTSKYDYGDYIYPISWVKLVDDITDINIDKINEAEFIQNKCCFL